MEANRKLMKNVKERNLLGFPQPLPKMQKTTQNTCETSPLLATPHKNAKNAKANTKQMKSIAKNANSKAENAKKQKQQTHSNKSVICSWTLRRYSLTHPLILGKHIF